MRGVKLKTVPLQRQAGKQCRYKQIRPELQDLDTQLARHQFDVLQGEINERQATSEKLRSEIEVSSANVLQREDEIMQLREQLSTLEHQISEMQQRGLELKGQVDRQESRVQFNEERLNELDSQNSKALADISQAEERHLVAGQESEALAERLAVSEAALAQHRDGLQAKQQALQTVEAELRRLQEAQRQAQSEAFAQAQHLTRARNEITALD